MSERGVADPQVAMEEADLVTRGMFPSVELYSDALEILKALQVKDKKFYNLDTLKAHNPTHVVEDFTQVIGIVS